MNIQERMSAVEATNGKFFTVSFTKKDGSERILTGRLNVAKYTKGGVNPNPKIGTTQIGVYDTRKKAYRTINLETVKWMHFQRKTVVF